MNVPVFIDLGEFEQLNELRSVLREKGSSIPEENENEDLVANILQVLEASDVVLGDDFTDEDVEAIYNSIVSLILIIPVDQSGDIVDLMCSKLAPVEKEDAYAGAKLRVLSNLFQGLDERSPIRFTLYTSLVKIAGKANLIEQLDTSVSQLKKWIEMWDINTQNYQILLRSIHEALVECKQSEKATKIMIELLGTYTEDNASQARDDAHRCIVTHLADPNTFILDHLLTLKPVKFLEGELIHDLLTIFVSGKLHQYLQFYDSNKDFINTIGLSHDDNIAKMRVLTMMTIAETKKEIEFDMVMKEMKLQPEEIEPFIIDLIHTKTVRAKIDGMQRKVLISSTTHRTFGKVQWQQLREDLGSWQSHLESTLSSLQTLIHHQAPAAAEAT